MPTAMRADAVVNHYFLEMRAKVLDVAAAMDRVERGEGAEALRNDERLAKLRRAIEVLLDNQPNRAERVLMIFSDPYEPGWPRPARR